MLVLLSHASGCEGTGCKTVAVVMLPSKVCGHGRGMVMRAMVRVGMGVVVV